MFDEMQSIFAFKRRYQSTTLYAIHYIRDVITRDIRLFTRVIELSKLKIINILPQSQLSLDYEILIKYAPSILSSLVYLHFYNVRKKKCRFT